MQYGISENTVNTIKLLLSNKMIDVNIDTGIVTVIKEQCNNIKILNSNYGYNRQDRYGYYYLHVRINNKYYDIKDHMIIAFLVYGNSIIGNQIDHINNYHNYRYDNRATNLQVLSIEKHIKKSNSTYKNLNRTIVYYPKHHKVDISTVKNREDDNSNTSTIKDTSNIYKDKHFFYKGQNNKGFYILFVDSVEYRSKSILRLSKKVGIPKKYWYNED